MSFLWTNFLCFLLCLVKVFPKQDFFGFTGKDDTTLMLEQAFAQAGIPLADYQPTGLGGPIPPPRASLFQRLRFPFISRARNRLKLANSLLPKPLKLDNEHLNFMEYVANHRYPSQFMLPPINAMNHLYPPPWHPNDRKVPPLIPQPTAVSSTSRPPEPPVPPPTQITRGIETKHSDTYSNKYKYHFGFKPVTVRTTAASFAENSPFNRKSSLSKRLSGRSEKKYHNHQEDMVDTLSNDIIFPRKIVTNRRPLTDVNPSDLLNHFGGDEWDHNSTGVDCVNKDLGWCDYSSQYPTIYVRSVVKQCLEILDRMYVEVPENLANFDDYVPFAPANDSNGQLDHENVAETWSWAGYRSKNNLLCDAERKYIRPSIAQDINGRWYLIVQTSLYHQKVPIEVCRNPGGVCNNLNKCSKTSRCVQKFGTQLLISLDLDKEDECPIMKLYRFPYACVCDSANYQ